MIASSRAPSRSGRRRLCFIVNDAAFFASHRLPIAIAAVAAGYEVHVACPPGPASEGFAAHGLRHHALAISRGRGSLWSFIALARDYVALFLRVRPDVVHLITAKPIILAGTIARIARVPALHAVSGLGFLFIHRGWRVRLAKALALRGYDLAINHPNAHTILQNEDDIAAFAAYGLLDRTGHTLIRGSGVDLERFRACDEPPGIPVVLLPARMLRDKGVEEFVAAARILRDRGVTAQFLLQGQIDPANPTAIAAAELAGWEAEGIVRWASHDPAIERVLERSHIVAFPSYREGMPKTLIDTAAAGRPCVTTDVPGCRHAIVPGQTGLLARVRDATDLADKLQLLIEDAPRRAAMGRAARGLAERRYDIRQVVAEHLGLYATLLANGR